LPQSFAVGTVVIHYYGLVMAAAVLAGYLLARKRAARYGLSAGQADDIIFWAVIGGFVGARLYHIASSFGYYWTHPADIIKVWNGGLSIYGVIFGGMLAILLYQKILHHKSYILNLFDWLAPSVLLGQIIGRFGNLFNYEIIGYPTNLPWKMFVPAAFRPVEYLPYAYFHPFFLYEVLGNIIIFIYLLKFRKNRWPGSLSFSYLLLYNALRFFLEFIRTDSTFIGPLRLNAVMSFALAATAAGCLWSLKRYNNRDAEIS